MNFNLNKDKFKNKIYELYEDSLTTTINQESKYPLFTELEKIDNDYEVIEPIAKGGMKTIYKAIHLKSQRMVAMAKLHNETPEDLYDPFIREARLTSLLDHPNIIKVYDLGIDTDHRPFFTMELKTGKTLEDTFEEKKVSLNQRLNIFLKICEAIAYAHSKNILHLDIKPSNIQVGSFGELLICDWGLGRILNDEQDEIHNELLHPDLLNHMTLGGTIKGTPGYMAPEQIKGKNKDKKTDIYSLGMLLRSLLLESLTEGNTNEVLITRTLTGSWLKPSQIKPNLPKILDSIVLKAINVNPELRYEDVRSFHDDIEKVLNHYSPSTQEKDFLNEIKLFYKRHYVLCNLTILFLLSFFILSLYFTNELKLSRDDALAQKELAETHLNKSKTLSDNLEKEKQEIETLTKKMIESHKEISLASKKFLFDSPLKSIDHEFNVLNEILKSPFSNKWAHRQIGYLYFVKLNFSKSYEHFSINHAQYDEHLFELSKYYKYEYPNLHNDFKFSDLDEVIWRLVELKNNRVLIDTILSYQRELRGFDERFEKSIFYSLIALNPYWDRIYNYDFEEQRLTLGGKNLLWLTMNTKVNESSILRHLPIKELKIESSSFDRLDHLADLNHLEVLDLRGLRRINLLALPKLPLLKKIIIDNSLESKLEHTQYTKNLNIQFK